MDRTPHSQAKFAHRAQEESETAWVEVVNNRKKQKSCAPKWTESMEQNVYYYNSIFVHSIQ